jgi:hypothetical protein
MRNKLGITYKKMKSAKHQAMASDLADKWAELYSEVPKGYCTRTRCEHRFVNASIGDNQPIPAVYLDVS